MEDEEDNELIIKQKFGEVINKLEARSKESVPLGLKNVVEESKLYCEYLNVALKFETLAVKVAGGASLSITKSAENVSKGDFMDMFEHLALDNMNLENTQHHVVHQMADEAKCCTCKLPDFEEEAEKFRFNKCGFLRSDRQPLLIEGGIMRNHQLDGMDWLKFLYGGAETGILADEMGLGKRIQCIAALCYLIEAGVRGPFLVCAPTSSLCKWVSEFKTFAPVVPTRLYTGDRKELITKKSIPVLARQYITYPIQLISLEVLQREIKYVQSYDWKYAILDWEHQSENLNYKFLKDFRKLRADNFLLVTRTPLQNNLAELWFLLNFLMPEMFDEVVTFELWFADHFHDVKYREKILQQEEEQSVISLMQRVISPYMLRRLKADVKMDVPPKKDVIVYSPLTPLQEMLCATAVNKGMKNVVFPRRHISALDVKNVGEVICENEPLPKSTRKETSETEKAKEISAKFNQSVKQTCVQLRKIINHPYLFEYQMYSSAEDRIINENIIKYSGKFLILDSMLNSLKHLGHKVILFCSTLSLVFVIEDYLMLREYKYTRLYETQRKNEEVFIYIATSQPGGPGINLAAVANSIIIFDSDWELKRHVMPKDNYQGIDHTYPVVIYRIVSSKTIEEFLCGKNYPKKKPGKIEGRAGDEAAKKI